MKIPVQRGLVVSLLAIGALTLGPGAPRGAAARAQPHAAPIAAAAPARAATPCPVHMLPDGEVCVRLPDSAEDAAERAVRPPPGL